MKTIGLLGGMSWQSTVEYYRMINSEVSRRLGGLHSAKILLYSADFSEIERYQRENDWAAAGASLAEAAQALERAGAELLLICANTMHKVADRVQDALRIPVVHIADATAENIRKAGLERVGLLGTKYTMEQDFLKKRLAEHGLQILIPELKERDLLHRMIYEELCSGIITEHSRTRLIGIMEALAERGAEGMILGCTELPLLVKPDDVSYPLFDTTFIHAEKAVRTALDHSEA